MENSSGRIGENDLNGKSNSWRIESETKDEKLI